MSGSRPSAEVEKRYRQSPKGRATRNKAQARRREADGHQKDRVDWRKRKYGLSQERYEALFKQQNGLCKLCLKMAETEYDGVLRVDHDHATGKVRGLLCHCCNSALGHFHDNQELLLRAVTYLRGEL